MDNKRERGITLIALVVTIIILLVLAGVSINALTSDGGLLSKSKDSVEKYKQEQIKEELAMKVMEMKMDGEEITTASLASELNKYGSVNVENGQIISVVLSDGTEIPISNIYEGTYSEQEITCITSLAELKAFRDSVNNGNNYNGEVVMLMNDIDMEGSESNSSTWWVPIGNDSSKAFKGTFDGNNHKLTNMYVSTYYENIGNGQVGFFGYIENAEIRNVEIGGTVVNPENQNGNIIRRNLGGIVGSARGTGKVTIKNCINRAYVRNYANNSTAGIIGDPGVQEGGTINTSIINCINYGKVETAERAGGICGWTTNGEITIENCHNYGEIVGNTSSAGIMSAFKSSGIAIIKNCSNENKVTSNSSNAGGIIGEIADCNGTVIVEDSINKQNVNSCLCAGGIVGYLLKNANLVINNCHNEGQIKQEDTNEANGYAYAGGILGRANNSINNPLYITNCYNSGSVTSEDWMAGGILGETCLQNKIYNCYNKGSVSGKNTAGGLGGAIAWGSKTGTTSIEVNNFYQIGALVSDNNTNSGIIKRHTAASISIDNSYYLNTTASVSVQNYNASDTIDNSASKTEIELKSAELLSSLNAYVTANPTCIAEGQTIHLNKWKTGQDGYPEFE